MLVCSRLARAGCVPLLLALLLGIAGCGSDDEPAATPPTSSPPVPVPDGVQLTEPGSTLKLGEAATAAYVISRNNGAVVRVRVEAIRRGAPADFSGFNLDPRTSRATPWYVRATMAGVGRGSVGGAPVPLFGFDSSDTYFPAADISGTFSRCPAEPVPRDFGPGDRTRTCLVFFVPPRLRLKAVQLRAEDDVEPISWPVPRQRGGARLGG